MSESSERESLFSSRDPECVMRWPDCEDGAYHPNCCRFPKSCSCGDVAENDWLDEPGGLRNAAYYCLVTHWRLRRIERRSKG